MTRFTPLILVVAACTGAGQVTTTQPPASTSTTVPASTTTLAPPVVDCPAPPYRVDILPERVAASTVASGQVPTDPYTAIPGTRSAVWLDASGLMVVALIRGTLPPEEWPGEKGEVEIDGAKAVAGVMADGNWVVGWYEEPGERCDLYTMVFFQPVTPEEVRTSLVSMDRVAG